MTTASILDIRDLSVEIPTDSATLKAVRGISLDLKRGETLGIVGESGSGKSMTALAIMNLLPPSARRAAACINFDGSDLAHSGERELATKVRGQRIGMIFQEPMTSLNPVYSIGRQLTETMTIHRKVSRAEAEQRAIQLLEKVGLPDPASRLKQYPHELSGGQRQRVMIAMALMNKPELLLCMPAISWKPERPKRCSGIPGIPTPRGCSSVCRAIVAMPHAVSARFRASFRP